MQYKQIIKATNTLLLTKRVVQREFENNEQHFS